MTNDAIPQTTVIIATKDRREDLRRALDSALAQRPAVDIIVIDDGSSDDSSAMVRADYPQVRLERHDEPRGYIVARNLGARLARTELLVCIDDDAQFSSPAVVAQTAGQFDHPRVAGVAIPYKDVRRSERLIPDLPPPPEGQWYVCNTFTGTAHALRRAPLLAVGGYREALFHQGEERDLTLRLLARGWVIRLGRGDPILHYESPQRASARVSLFGRRNDLLFVWHNAPARWLLPELLAASAKGLRYGWRTGRTLLMARGVWRGWCALPGHWRQRQAVAPAVYRLHRKLTYRGPFTLAQVEGELPAISEMVPASSPG